MNMTSGIDDFEAIRQLKARYFRTMDTKDWAGMRQVFTDDVVIDTSEAGDRIDVSVISRQEC